MKKWIKDSVSKAKAWLSPKLKLLAVLCVVFVLIHFSNSRIQGGGIDIWSYLKVFLFSIPVIGAIIGAVLLSRKFKTAEPDRDEKSEPSWYQTTRGWILFILSIGLWIVAFATIPELKQASIDLKDWIKMYPAPIIAVLMFLMATLWWTYEQDPAAFHHWMKWFMLISPVVLIGAWHWSTINALLHPANPGNDGKVAATMSFDFCQSVPLIWIAAVAIVVAAIVLALNSKNAGTIIGIFLLGVIFLWVGVPRIASAVTEVKESLIKYKMTWMTPGPQYPPERTSVPYTIRSDELTSFVVGDHVDIQKWKSLTGIQKLGGVTILVWKSKESPLITGAKAQLILGPEEEGLIDIYSRGNFADNLDPYWFLVVEKGNSTLINAVYGTSFVESHGR